MATLTATVPPAERITADKSWVEGVDHKNDLVNYLYLFNHTISNTAPGNLSSIATKVINSRFISVAYLKVIEKRFINIPMAELDDPLKLIQKHWEIRTTLSFLMEKVEGESFSKTESLLEFYTKYGYLTKKQINLSKWIGGKLLKEEISIWLNNPTNESMLTAMFKETLSMLNPDVELNVDTEPTANPFLKSFYDMFELLTIIKEVEEEQEEPQEIPQAFLSLVDMRKALLFQED